MNIVHEHGLLIFTATVSCHGLLQSLQKLILGVVKILDERSHTFDLSVKVGALLLFGRKVLLALTQVILEALPFVLDQSQHLLEVDDLKLSLVLLVLGLQCRVLTIVDLRVHFGNLLSSLADVLLESGIIALHRLKLLLQPRDLVLPQFRLCSFLLELSLDVALRILERLDVLALSLYFSLGLKTPLYSSLDLEAILLEETKLLHEGVLLGDQLLVVLRQFLSVFSVHLELSFLLTDLLSQLVALKFTTSVILNDFSLVVSG